MSPLQWVTAVVVFAGFPPILAFTILYGVRSPWRSNLAGRTIMQLSVALNLLYLLASVNTLFGLDWPGRGYARLLIFLFTTAALIRMPVTLLRYQRMSLLEESPSEDGRGITPDRTEEEER